MLFKNRHVVGAHTFIPVKLVATNDSQVVNEVIKATNRQTEVLPEALESLSTFHRELEDLYNTQESGNSSSERIYYERRSKQYAMDNIMASNIVTLTGQITSFVGMFLDEPHSHPRYYGELLKAYEGRIFATDHGPAPYYASGVSLLIVERWLNSHGDWRELRPYKHQLLMLLRTAISGPVVPKLNSRHISPYALKIVNVLRDPIRGPEELNRAVELLKNSWNNFVLALEYGLTKGREILRIDCVPFTEQLKHDRKDESVIPRMDDSRLPALIGTQDRGPFKFFDDVKWYGFISSSTGQDIFVHGSEMDEIP